MADKKISALPAVVTPAPTDESPVNQGGVTKKVTRAQTHALESGEHLVLPQVSEVATPTLAFGDGDSGFFEPIDDNIQVSLVGIARFFYELDAYNAVAGTGPAMINVAAGAAVASFVPRRSDGDTGIGSAGGDILTLVAGGVEIARATEVVGANQFIVAPGLIDNNAAAPALAFGDGDTGIYLAAVNELGFSTGGVLKATLTAAGRLGIGTPIPAAPLEVVGDQPGVVGGFQAGAFQVRGDGTAQFSNAVITGHSSFNGNTQLWYIGSASSSNDDILILNRQNGSISFSTNNIARFVIQADGTIKIVNKIENAVGTAALPSYSFTGDPDTGVFNVSADILGLTAGGVQGLQLTELNSGVIQAPVADVAITAFATGGQASAVALKQSYNVLSVVATTGDSVKLPDVFDINSIIYVKNDGANSADVFPATGDDLGQGLNTAEALAAGVSASYIATVANTTWTPLLAAAAAGAADPSLLGDGTAGAPSYSFTSDTDTGMFLSFTDTLSFAIAGTRHWSFQPGALISHVGNGPELLNEASTTTNPTVIPNFGSPTSGIGGGAGKVSIVAAGLDCINIAAVGAVRQCGFYVTTPISLQTGVAVTAAGVHAALVNLGLITA